MVTVMVTPPQSSREAVASAADLPRLDILLLNQAFYPDVVSTAQHAADLAAELARQGHRVTVVASSRGYDDPKVRFPRRERWQGVEIVRIACTGFGKSAKWRRALDFTTFLLSCCWRLLWMRRFDVALAMTSPPLISFIAALLVPWRARRMVVWVMDLNPDEAIAAGWLKPRSLTARLLMRLQMFSFRRAAAIIALDRFMQQRLIAKGVDAERIVVIPPWSHDDTVRFDLEGRRQFRAAQGVQDKFVVMYSGNHSPCHPLDTLLQAARAMLSEADITFCFVGGGSEFQRVRATAARDGLANVLTLAYQPREKLAASLSAADVHVVVMGDGFEGIVHPCKIYNILAVGSPLLYIGPRPSHVTDILAAAGQQDDALARMARHGDIEAVTSSLRELRDRWRTTMLERSDVHLRLASSYSKALLVAHLAQVSVRPAGPHTNSAREVET